MKKRKAVIITGLESPTSVPWTLQHIRYIILLFVKSPCICSIIIASFSECSITEPSISLW